MIACNAISVVIPAYRAAGTIERAISSIVKSVGVNAEIIVVEDGIYDDLRDAISGFPNIKLITNQTNMGAAAARNVGLAHANNPYVFFLDADDYVDPYLFTHLREAICNTGAGIAFGPWRFVYDNQPSANLNQPILADNATMVAGWLRNNAFPPCAVMWRTEAIRQIGGWNPTFKHNDDAELVLRALIHGVRYAVAQQGCGYYVQHDSPHRVSRASAQVASAAALSIYEMVESWLLTDGVNQAVVRPAMADFAYELARRSYRAGARALGDQWLTRARLMGLRRHPGSLLHQCLTTIIGLPSKERLASIRDHIPLFRHRFQ